MWPSHAKATELIYRSISCDDRVIQLEKEIAALKEKKALVIETSTDDETQIPQQIMLSTLSKSLVSLTSRIAKNTGLKKKGDSYDFKSLTKETYKKMNQFNKSYAKLLEAAFSYEVDTNLETSDYLDKRWKHLMKKYEQLKQALDMPRSDEDPISEEVMENVRSLYVRHSSGIKQAKIKNKKLEYKLARELLELQDATSFLQGDDFIEAHPNSLSSLG